MPLLGQEGSIKPCFIDSAHAQGFFKITIYCVQKLGTVHKPTPSHSQPHSLPFPGIRHCYGVIEHRILDTFLDIHKMYFFYKLRSKGFELIL